MGIMEHQHHHKHEVLDEWHLQLGQYDHVVHEQMGEMGEV